MSTPPNKPDGTVTRLLEEAERGNSPARDQLMARTLDELKAIARTHLRRFGLGGRKGETSLVNDAVLRLLKREGLTAENRGHFFFIMKRAMHDVLVEQIQQADAIKRGGGRARVPLEEAAVETAEAAITPSELREAIEELEASDANAAHSLLLIEVYGCTIQEAASALDRTFSQTRDDYTYARAALKRRLSRSIF